MLQLDISKIDPYKIDQYDRWPVSQKELHDVRDALLKYSVQPILMPFRYLKTNKKIFIFR